MRPNTLTKVERKALKLLIPGDHGAYAMLLVPALIGLIAGVMRGFEADFPALLLLCLALLGCFFTLEPVDVLSRPNANPAARQRAILWLSVYLVVAALSGLTLLIGYGRWQLLWLLLPGSVPLPVFIIAKKFRKQRSIGVRLVGIAALTLSAPAAYYTVTGQLNSFAMALWVATLVYFGSAQFYIRSWFEVRATLKKSGSKKVPGWLVRSTRAFLLAGVVILGIIIGQGLLPATILLAYIPLLVKLAMAFYRPPIAIPIKQIGLYEFAQSFVFALLLLLSLR